MTDEWELSTLSGAPGASRRTDADPASRWELYRLLADPVRHRLLGLVALQELGVGELAELLGESQSKVSRHASALRDGGMIRARRHGSWTLLSLDAQAVDDPVIADAVRAGSASCKSDGTVARIDEVLAARDAATREFFARSKAAVPLGAPPELGAYLAAFAPLLPHRALAIDAGTGDGALLEVLSPVFRRVVALDRAESRLAVAAERVRRRELSNVALVCGELDGPELRAQTGDVGADAVFASRVLHHAPVPERMVGSLARLARTGSASERGGAVIVLEYEAHEDQELSAKLADVWLGFTPDELVHMGQAAGLVDGTVMRLPAAWRGDGPDRHLNWQLYVGFKAPRTSA